MLTAAAAQEVLILESRTALLTKPMTMRVHLGINAVITLLRMSATTILVGTIRAAHLAEAMEGAYATRLKPVSHRATTDTIAPKHTIPITTEDTLAHHPVRTAPLDIAVEANVLRALAQVMVRPLPHVTQEE